MRNVTQRTTDEWVEGGACGFPNIEPMGDPLMKRTEKDGIHRMGYHNIHGSMMNRGLEVADELDIMQELGFDTQGMSEINKPWSA